MKKFCIFFLLSCILIVTALGGTGCSYPVIPEERFLRIHIRADSNDTEAQAVKYAVRDGVVEYLTPIVCKAQNFAHAATLLEEELDGLTTVANGVLRGQGFDYLFPEGVVRKKCGHKKLLIIVFFFYYTIKI
jgi:hypothetical protein